MKKIIVILILIFSFFLSGSSYEQIFEKQLESAEKSGFTEYIPDEVKKFLNSSGIDGIDSDALFNLSFSDFIDLLYESFINNFRKPFKSMLMIISSVLVCSIVQSFSDDYQNTGTVANAVITLISASVFLVPIKEVITYSANVIGECSNFMLSFIPVYSSSVAASGYISSAAGFRSLMLAAVTVISEISAEIILPLVSIYLALCISGAVSAFNIDEIAKTVKNFSVWLLSVLMTAFSGIMGLGTLISSTVDVNVSKTAKFLIGSTIPIVGSTVSDAMSTVKSCITVTKNILGIYAIIVIAVIFVPPIINLILWKTCLSFSCAIVSVLENKTLSKLLSSVSSVIGILLALVTVTAIMFIFAVSIMLMIGGGN